VKEHVNEEESMDDKKATETVVGVNRQDEAHQAARDHARALSTNGAGRSEDRDASSLRDAREAIGDVVHQRRMDFKLAVLRVFNRAAVFGGACGEALGTISRDEAVNVIQKDVHAELEKLR
jgi:hypothetical protein